MSQKMTCPACNAHLSSVYQAFENGEPCPNCGLSHEAAQEVLSAKARNADETLRARLTELLAERDAAVARAEKAESKLQRIKWELEGDD